MKKNSKKFKLNKKLTLNKREIKDLTTEDQIKLEGGTTYTCGNGCGTPGGSGSSGGSSGSTATPGNNATIYHRTCLGC